MKQSRKFYLQNGKGERRDLNGKNNIYFSDPTGLGITLSQSYADLGHGFFSPVSTDAEPQQQPGGTLNFTGPSPYGDYRSLINWINDAEDLTLIYSPYGSEEFSRRVDVNYISKGELNQVRWLVAPVSFNALTPWFRAAPANLALTVTEGNELRYTYYYTDELIYGANSTATMSAELSRAGHVPAAVRMNYTGTIINPRISLIGADSGKTYGVCSINVQLSNGDTLEFSTLQQDSFVRLRTSTGAVRDLLDTLDLSTEPFFRLPLEEPCILEVSADSVFSGAADLQVFYYYRSV